MAVNPDYVPSITVNHIPSIPIEPMFERDAEPITVLSGALTLDGAATPTVI